MNPTGPCMLWNNGDGYLFHCQFEKKERVKMRVYGSVLKPGPARRVDPSLGPVRVKAKTRSGIGPGKPGRPGGSTRDPVHPVKPG